MQGVSYGRKNRDATVTAVAICLGQVRVQADRSPVTILLLPDVAMTAVANHEA